MTGRRFSTAKKKSRGRANGLALPPTELLRNKANEMAALQGQMQYQATATSTGMGMSTGPSQGPGSHFQYKNVGHQMQGGGTSILPSFLQHPQPQQQPYLQQPYSYQQQQVPVMAQAMAQSRPMTSFAPMPMSMPMPPVQQMQVPTATAMMPAAASGSAMAATSPFGYNPTGPDYGHYHQTMGGMGMDGSVASHSFTSSPPPPFAGRQPQPWEEGQNLGDGYGAFEEGRGLQVGDYVDAFGNGSETFGDEDINIEPNDAIPTVIETRHPPMVPDGTRAQVPVANPYAKSSPDAGCGEAGQDALVMYQSSYAQPGNVRAPDVGNPYAATASAGEAAISTQSFDDAFF